MSMRNYTRFIPGEEIGAVEQWSFGAVDTASLLLAAQERARAEHPEPAHDQAQDAANEVIRQEGYADGFVQGHAQATLEAQRQIGDFMATQGQEAAQKFAQLFLSAQSQLADAEQGIARGILELACELARQVIRHELTMDTDVLQPVIREALVLLMTETKSAVVRLNPQDMETLAEVVRTEFSTLSLTLVGDATVSRGGCLVESAGTVVDGTLEKRWARAIASLGLNAPWEKPVDNA
jgi:flagellar assembly protein FliH